MKQYWLLKSEPYKWSWQQQKSVKSEPWDGVRNYQARNFMKSMKVGDEGFFYHSNEGKEIVGIIQVVKTHYPDPTDPSGKFVCVDVAAQKDMPKPVTLQKIKETEALQNMALLKQARLSVSPVRDTEWMHILRMGGL